MKKQYLNKDELTRLLTVARNLNQQHWLMMVTAFLHGLRATEVMSLKGTDITHGYITVKRLKGSLETCQPLVESDNPLFNEKPYLEALAKEVKNDRLFPWTRNWFWMLVQKYGRLAYIHPSKCHPHIFKHSIAHATIKEAGIEHVRQRLGHASISSTGEYLTVTDDEAAHATKKALAISLNI
jgi:site-specific recombinase XerD